MRMIATTRLALLFFAALGIACPPEGARDLSVMTRNLYFGFSEEGLLLAPDFETVVIEASLAWQSVLDTDFPERAERLAAEIAESRPDFVGLQEAALYRIQSPGDILTGGSTPATQVVFDFVEILRAALTARGLSYDVVVSLDHMDVELPVLSGDDVRLTDRDVLLARSDLPRGHLAILDTDAGHFDTLLELPVGGPDGPVLLVRRGWVSADVRVRGEVLRIVNTHLESDIAAVQEPQALELLAGPAATDLPVILLGDFNSDAFGTGTDSYELLIEGGFVDAWTEANPGQPGLTWGQDPDLLNPVSTLSERLDLILFRGPFFVDRAWTTGDDPDDRTASGLWPSDHAGVGATLGLAEARPR